MTVTMEDPSRGQTPPHILCYSSSLKHLMSVSDAASWDALQMLKPPPNGRCSLLDHHKHSSPQASGTLRIDHADPKDTALLPHNQPVRGRITFSAVFFPWGSLLSRSVVSDSLWPHGPQPARLLCPWDSPGKNIRLGCQAALSGDLPDPGIKLMSPLSPALVGGFFTTSVITWPLENALLQGTGGLEGSEHGQPGCPAQRLQGPLPLAAPRSGIIWWALLCRGKQTWVWLSNRLLGDRVPSCPRLRTVFRGSHRA